MCSLPAVYQHAGGGGEQDEADGGEPPYHHLSRPDIDGGEDNRLLFTVPILSLEKFRREFQTFDIIGHLAQPEAGAVLVTPEGVELPLRAPGWPEAE